MAELYLLTCRTSGKRYVGVTKHTAAKRWRSHVNRANREWAFSPLHCAIRKHGADDFEVKTLLRADLEYVIDREQPAIEAFRTMLPNGYNAKYGGEFPAMIPETCEKISKGNKGRPKSAQHVAALRGKKRTPEQRLRMSLAKRPPHTPEQRAKVSAGLRRHWADPQAREARKGSMFKAWETRRKNQTGVLGR